MNAKTMNRYISVSAVLISLLLTACGGNGKPSKSMLPPASGKAGEMIVVMDSVQWSTQLGDALRATFRAEVPGLPREEYLFKMNRVEPSKMTRILRTVKNLVFVVTLDRDSPAARRIRSYFTEESLARIRAEDDLFVFTAEDEFARGQQVMYLFGQTEEQLINKINQNSEFLQNFFNQVEERRLKESLLSTNASQGLTKTLEEQFGCTMDFPFGYQVAHLYQSAQKTRGFIWFRQMNPKNDKNIFVSYIPYRSEDIFAPENLIALRDSIAQRQLYGDPDKPETYLKTETSVPFIPVTVDRITFNEKFAVRMGGLWKTNNISMGGPFIAYAMVDETTGRLYYIEGFVYSPGEAQREHMRELKVILNTFRTRDMMNGKGASAP